jgi:hypothetical protein
MKDMKRILIVALAVAACVPALAPAAAPHARVWLAGTTPLTVKGSGFKAGERVAVTLTAGKRFLRTTNATSTGTLTASWTGKPVEKAGCLSVHIQADGNRGSVATYKAAGKECAPGPASPGA